ncbi:MAG: succinate dehydrogenase [Proteobacteria bacterium]|nr:succinate dehydrogenase [Pseudomonadota bacterium]
MTVETIKVNVFRYDPSVDQDPYYQTYDVPWETGMSAMTALDYIYNHLDGTLAYYDHAGCDLGICAGCAGKINGKAGLFCQTAVEGEITLEPRKKDRVLKDLITLRADSVS